MIAPERKQAWLDQLKALGLALVVHLVIVAVMVLGTWEWQPFQAEQVPVRVTLVDQAPGAARREEAQANEAAEAERQQQIQREAQRQREVEAQRQREMEAEREREVQAQRQREEQARLEAERERRDQELARQRAEREERERQAALRQERELERQRQEEQRQREEAERLRELAELRLQREAAQREREEQEARLEALAERRAAEEAERQAAEQAERLRLADQRAQADARRATLGEEYVATIRELVRRNWNRPPTTRPGLACRTRVVQIPGGEIIAAEIVSPCNADDATRRSIIAAVLRVGFLPYQGYESVFSREIDFDFIYDG